MASQNVLGGLTGWFTEGLDTADQREAKTPTSWRELTSTDKTDSGAAASFETASK